VVSPGLLHREWMASRRERWTKGARAQSHAERLLGELAPTAGLVTVIDGSPGTLSWLGAVKGSRTSALGVDSFGQVGDLQDLYREYRLDADAIIDACADLFLS
jgi:pyruvate dehydrogenase E1 component